jgi:hypothetical protein
MATWVIAPLLIVRTPYLCFEDIGHADDRLCNLEYLIILAHGRLLQQRASGPLFSPSYLRPCAPVPGSAGVQSTLGIESPTGTIDLADDDYVIL